MDHSPALVYLDRARSTSFSPILFSSISPIHSDRHCFKLEAPPLRFHRSAPSQSHSCELYRYVVYKDSAFDDGRKLLKVIFYSDEHAVTSIVYFCNPNSRFIITLILVFK
jgi:hypothetical protein